jgi:hypothetical protein
MELPYWDAAADAAAVDAKANAIENDSYLQ